MSEPLKVSMTPEDINKALKWSRDTIEAQAAEIHSLKVKIEQMKTYLTWIEKRATVLPYEEDSIDQLKLNLSKIKFWAECMLETEEGE
jgi:hypothetical protein